jgi:hypothetical protein
MDIWTNIKFIFVSFIHGSLMMVSVAQTFSVECQDGQKLTSREVLGRNHGLIEGTFPALRD